MSSVLVTMSHNDRRLTFLLTRAWSSVKKCMWWTFLLSIKNWNKNEVLADFCLEIVETYGSLLKKVADVTGTIWWLTPSTSAKPEDHHPGERPQPPFTSVWCPGQGIYSTTLPSGLGWTNSKRKQKYCPPTLGKTPNSQISSIRIYGFSPKTTKVCSMDRAALQSFC